jgi:hypothetical protein
MWKVDHLFHWNIIIFSTLPRKRMQFFHLGKCLKFKPFNKSGSWTWMWQLRLIPIDKPNAAYKPRILTCRSSKISMSLLIPAHVADVLGPDTCTCRWCAGPWYLHMSLMCWPLIPSHVADVLADRCDHQHGYQLDHCVIPWTILLSLSLSLRSLYVIFLYHYILTVKSISEE